MAEDYISQFYDWSTSDVITAARLDGNITNITNGLSGGSKAINVGKILMNGTEVISSTRVGTFTQLNTDNIRLDGNTISSTDTNGNVNIVPNGTGDVAIAAIKNGWVSNLAITYASSTLSVTGSGGTALSGTNIGYVSLPSKASPGQSVTIGVTANQGFIDDSGASEIIGNLFGATTGVAWANDVPFYIYAVSNDDEDTIAFMISRVPHMTTSPAVGEIGAPDDAVADNSYSFFSFDNIDEGVYDGNPCICIGSFRMQMSSSDDWTVQTLGNGDGIGLFQEGVVFTMPLGQNGAATGSHFKANGGTAPVFSATRYEYQITREGRVFCSTLQSGDGGTDGVGAVNTQLATPLTSMNLAGGYVTGAFAANSATGGFRVLFGDLIDNSTAVEFDEVDGTNAQNGDFGNGARLINGSWNYLAGIA
jgi:hypothetical protein